MDNESVHHLEKVALVGGIATALGGTAYVLTRKRRHEPNAGILNDERLLPEERRLLNKLAVEILFNYRPNRELLMEKMSLRQHQLSHLIGFLRDYGLAEYQPASKNATTPVHYAPSFTLGQALDQPDLYPMLETARQERVEAEHQPSDNS